MKKKNNLILGLVTLGIFIAFTVLTILLMTLDRHTFDNGIEIGLYEFNKVFVNKGPTYKIWDILSDILMYSTFSYVLFLVVIGTIQLFKYKSIKKVNPDILGFGIMLVVVVCWWLVFDKGLIVNHRPILIDGVKESSYPSTHVLLVTFIMLGLANYLAKRLNSKFLGVLGYIGAALIISALGTFRILANMHWVTDVIGAILLGTSCSFVSFMISDILAKKFNYKISERESI